VFHKNNVSHYIQDILINCTAPAGWIKHRQSFARWCLDSPHQGEGHSISLRRLVALDAQAVEELALTRNWSSGSTRWGQVRAVLAVDNYRGCDGLRSVRSAATGADDSCGVGAALIAAPRGNIP